jgi:predicted transcriptional regulator
LITRSRLEIYLDLLLAASQHIDLFSIADKVRLTIAEAKDHLTFLASQGVVETQFTDNHTIIYELSAKGSEMLMAFLRLSGRTGSVLEKQLTT